MDVDELPSLLQLDRERDEALLRAVMELALDPAAIGCGGQHQPLPRRTQLLDLRILQPRLANRGHCDRSALDDPDQLDDVDGLGEIAVEPDVEETLAVASHRLRGQRDHGDRGRSLVPP